MEVIGQLHAPVAVWPNKKSQTSPEWKAGWTPRLVEKGIIKYPRYEKNPRSLVVYPMRHIVVTLIILTADVWWSCHTQEERINLTQSRGPRENGYLSDIDCNNSHGFKKSSFSPR